MHSGNMQGKDAGNLREEPPRIGRSPDSKCLGENQKTFVNFRVPSG